MMPVTAPQDPHNLTVALAHARAGRRVFPCDPASKRPSISKRAGGSGYKDATTDEAIIRGWWAQYPDAIVGMPTGQRSGVFVVDVDVKAGKQGEDTLAQIQSTFGQLPETIETITATGGRHLFFRHPRDGRTVPNKGSRLGVGSETWGRDGFPAVPFQLAPNGQLVTPDVDIRGDGGYVILPGSRMLDGREYGWEGSSDPDEGAQLADAPAWLLALVAIDPPAPSAGGQDHSSSALGSIEEGGRNEFLYRLGCSLRAKGLGEAAIEAALLAENQSRCRPPLPDGEVRATAKSAASKPAGLSPAYVARADQAQARRQKKPDLRIVGGTATRPQVQIVAGELPANTDDAERYLKASGAEVFQHGNRLIRVAQWDAPPGAVKRPVGAGVLVELSDTWLVDAMTKAINFTRYDKRAADWVATDCPSKIAKTLLARTGDWSFSHLLGFCDSPVITPDGRVITAPGYDEPSALYLTNPPAIEAIPERCTRDDADIAAETLFELFSTFPYACDADKSALLAMAMTVLLRRVLPSAPIGCVSASTPGTGKSLLADCLAVLATGRTASATAIGKDSEELEKRLDSVLLKGDAVCLFDNVDRAVKSDVLCQVTTQAHKTVRILAQSKVVECPTNVALLMTGNNLTLLGDLTRRTLVCNLDAGCERPELREFDRDAVAHVLAHRSDGIRAALVLAKAYLDAGAPKLEIPHFGSFEAWDRLIRRPLVWAGWPDPLAPSEEMRDQDHEFSGMTEFLAAWHGCAQGMPMTAAELLELITQQDLRESGGYVYTRPELVESAQQVFGSLKALSARDLGYRLRHWKGRILDGLRIVDAKKGKGGVRWSVERV